MEVVDQLCSYLGLGAGDDLGLEMAYAQFAYVGLGDFPPWGKGGSCDEGRHERVNFDLAGQAVDLGVRDLVADRDAFDASCFGAGA